MKKIFALFLLLAMTIGCGGNTGDEQVTPTIVRTQEAAVNIIRVDLIGCPDDGMINTASVVIMLPDGLSVQTGVDGYENQIHGLSGGGQLTVGSAFGNELRMATISTSGFSCTNVFNIELIGARVAISEIKTISVRASRSAIGSLSVEEIFGLRVAFY